MAHQTRWLIHEVPSPHVHKPVKREMLEPQAHNYPSLLHSTPSLQSIMSKLVIKNEPVSEANSNTIRAEEDDQKAPKETLNSAVVFSGSSKAGVRCCQADNCGADMGVAKQYHRRHKVCEVHAKAQVVLVAGIRQRFCQQCSRFHEVSEFDESKRSCRRRLAGHNERRRKSPAAAADPHRGLNGKAGMVCGRAEDGGRFKYSLPDKQFSYN